MTTPIMNIQEIQEAQAHFNRIMASLEPRSAYGEAIKVAGLGAVHYAEKITHVDTGALKASHRFEMYADESGGTVFIDPGAVRKDGKVPSVYGPYEEARGGSHAFYERTVNEAGERLGALALKTLTEAFDGR